jgi:hypothetical protein
MSSIVARLGALERSRPCQPCRVAARSIVVRKQFGAPDPPIPPHELVCPRCGADRLATIFICEDTAEVDP